MWRLLVFEFFYIIFVQKVIVAKTITKQRPRNRTKIQEGVVERKSSIFSDLFWTPAQKNGKGRKEVDTAGKGYY